MKKEQKYLIVSFNIEKEMYEKIKGMLSPDCPTLSMAFRKILRGYFPPAFGGFKVSLQDIVKVSPLPTVVDGTRPIEVEPPEPTERWAAHKFAERGIDMLAVIRAKRAKNHGRDYDKSLEQYFDKI
jgi:hypothetical protein